MPLRFDLSSPSFDDSFEIFLNNKRETNLEVRETVAIILEDVRARGDAALCEATEKFDRFKIICVC